MNIENILYEYPTLPQTIVKLNGELNELIKSKNDIRNTVKAQVMTGMPHGTEISDPTLNAVKELIDKQDIYIQEKIRQVAYYIDIKHKLDEILLKLSPAEKQIIEIKYFDRCPKYEIPRIMKYCRSRCFQLQDEAIEKIKIGLN
jgi:DNA-directed RNA polymerase specialized sigma subunit